MIAFVCVFMCGCVCLSCCFLLFFFSRQKRSNVFFLLLKSFLNWGLGSSASQPPAATQSTTNTRYFCLNHFSFTLFFNTSCFSSQSSLNVSGGGSGAAAAAAAPSKRSAADGRASVVVTSPVPVRINQRVNVVMDPIFFLHIYNC